MNPPEYRDVYVSPDDPRAGTTELGCRFIADTWKMHEQGVTYSASVQPREHVLNNYLLGDAEPGWKG